MESIKLAVQGSRTVVHECPSSHMCCRCACCKDACSPLSSLYALLWVVYVVLQWAFMYLCIYGQAWLRPLMVITFAILFPLFLQVLQFRLIYHLLHQVFLPAHAITQVFGHVWNHMGYEGLNAKHQVLWRI